MGIENWKGLVPVLNFMEWGKAVGRPNWYVIWLFVPIVNLFIFVGLAVDLARSFGKYKFIHTAISVIYAPAMVLYLAFQKSEKYISAILPREREYHQKILDAKKNGTKREYESLVTQNPYKKSAGREWIESIVFAVFAAAFIRMFLIEAYVIPTPSMEGSLLVGDFLFVSKAHYGIRTPMTVAMVPLLHNRVPILGGESYIKSPSLPYYRLKALEDIDNNDPIVFNWPVGDSVYITKQRSYTVSQINQNPEFLRYDSELGGMVRRKEYVVRPLDKKDHYIKRCVAKAGDTLQIINRQVFINGKEAENPEKVQFLYRVSNTGSTINKKRLNSWGIEDADVWGNPKSPSGYFLDNEQVEKMRSLGNGIQVIVQGNPREPKKLFPHDPANFPNWSVDNYGPIWIPKAGVTIDINPENIALYKRAISVYEGNDLRVEGDKIFINNQEANKYTFNQDYYWAMGDNRHNSEDSRMWGYVPGDHIVGKPLFIWLSTKNGSIASGIRWNRMFRSADIR
jgi:signal peptidase I